MRRAQASLEYLFMVGTAIMLVAITIKYLKPAAEQTAQNLLDNVNKYLDYVTREFNKNFNAAFQ